MFDDFLRRLRELERRARRLDGRHEVAFAEIFPDEFMLRNTEFPSIAAFIDASGFTVDTAEDFEAIPDDLWDDHVRLHTRFACWDDMQQAAAGEWAKRQLGLE